MKELRPDLACQAGLNSAFGGFNHHSGYPVRDPVGRR